MNTLKLSIPDWVNSLLLNWYFAGYAVFMILTLEWALH